MKKKTLFQLAQDLVMTVVLLSLFGYHLYDESTHGWLGIAFFALIISHLVLNTWWLKTLFSAKPTPYSLLQYSINFTTFLLFFTACISGIMLSKHLLAEMPFHSTSDLIRKIHMTSTHWLQIMIGVHLGLHWKAITNLLANAYRLDLDHWLARKLIPACGLIIAAYGVVIFLQRDLLPYLLLQVDFAYFNYGEPQGIFYFDFFTILIATAYATRGAIWGLFFRKKKALA
ncbi:DUF4405 domain-containing protein [Avibacterium paragallinarum]|uniref:DUF4405 domain-containing protein n=1 Tax=Avibacterium paragallinarum TaxID=728 RepID=UPI001451FA44|nr:DUF4405 domain-containing protein [Avibacterium paragallinarum]QJE09199.1 DUF4405 domain-containing protein [Avibacterium paragallinarum]QJE11395.1 DUF4405 domain-containing protein [Avibacterium paragallinarum]QJE13593.1 DUF4405 domain-containing protein [Avibacterium paragallinarum]QJE15794.1 DUF4405 domain-containing protein [Avibacterium paragallinarum]QJE17989.1 DUF4405 domain-containing protein [Avibacterium paragallinarum]